nr:uncharacterized protein LOC109758208 [Aegilops tauschii subsp. strangulata]
MGAEYVPEKPGLDAGDPPPRRLRYRLREIRLQGAPAAAPPAVSGSSSPPAEGEEKENEGAPQMPRRRGQMPLIVKLQKKQLQRMKIAELKQMCDKPDAVGVWDGNAPDPKLLVYLKVPAGTRSLFQDTAARNESSCRERGILKNNSSSFQTSLLHLELKK